MKCKQCFGVPFYFNFFFLFWVMTHEFFGFFFFCGIDMKTVFIGHLRIHWIRINLTVFFFWSYLIQVILSSFLFFGFYPENFLKKLLVLTHFLYLPTWMDFQLIPYRPQINPTAQVSGIQRCIIL